MLSSKLKTSICRLDHPSRNPTVMFNFNCLSRLKFRNHLRQSTPIGTESADKLYPILNCVLFMVTVNLFSPDVSLSLLIIRISEDLQFVRDTKK